MKSIFPLINLFVSILLWKGDKDEKMCYLSYWQSRKMLSIISFIMNCSQINLQCTMFLGLFKKAAYLFILNKYIYERYCKLECHKLYIILRQFGKSIYSINVTVFWLIYKIHYFFFIKIETLIKFSGYWKKWIDKKNSKRWKKWDIGIWLVFCFKFKKKWVWERKNCQNVLII